VPKNAIVWEEKMAREPWQCPFPDCKQMCNRHWNLERHIAGQHGGDGKPLRYKSAPESEKLALEKQHTRNILKKRYTLHTNSSSYSLSQPDYDPLRIYGVDRKNETAGEENKKGQNIMKTVKSDIVDIAYGTFKKLKDRNDKVKEMTDYFSLNNAKMTIPFSYYFPLNLSNYNELKDELSYHVRSAFNSTSMPTALSASQVDKVQPKKLIGYVGHICRNCIESESLPVMYDPNGGNSIFRTQHICNPQNLDFVRRFPLFFREDVCFLRILTLSKQIAKTVKEWTKGGEVFLIAYKITSADVTKHTIELSIGRNQYKWLTRAILQKYNILNDEGLEEFFRLTHSVTFCHLRINYVEKEEQQMMNQGFYFLILNYKPCLPFEN
jgi:hypothetical protein